MLDFPNSPTTGQIFTAGSASWRWDNTKWTQVSGALSLPDAPQDSNTYGRRNAAWNSVDAMIAPVSATANAALNDAGRNLLINPSFNIQQRSTGPWTANGNYTADRWQMQLISDTASFSIVPVGSTPTGDEAVVNCIRNVFTGSSTAGAVNYLCQKIEKVSRLSGKTVTVSFWAQSNTAGLKIGCNIAQIFGTGGSPSAGVWVQATSWTVSAGAFTRYSATFTIPSISGKTLGTNGDDYTNLVFFYSAAGGTYASLSGNIGVQSGTIWITGCQLECGSVATQLDYGGTLQDQQRQCQRFYIGTYPFNYSGYNVAGANNTVQYPMPVPMRAAPTFTYNITGSSNVTLGSSSVSGGATYITLLAQTTAAGAFWYIGNFTASADL